MRWRPVRSSPPSDTTFPQVSAVEMGSDMAHGSGRADSGRRMRSATPSIDPPIAHTDSGATRSISIIILVIAGLLALRHRYRARRINRKRRQS